MEISVRPTVARASVPLPKYSSQIPRAVGQAFQPDGQAGKPDLRRERLGLAEKREHESRIMHFA